MLPENILVIRFSAMGDVLLLVPVLKSLTAAYPNLKVTLVTRPRFASFFRNIEGLQVFEADVDHKYSGMLGLRDLFKKLMRRSDYDLIIDLHDHLRTKILRTFFKIFAKRIVVFKKGRKEKKAFVRKNNKVTIPLPHTVERYHNAFLQAGYNFPLLSAPYLSPEPESKALIEDWLSENQLTKKSKWIGLAPFAMHHTKIYPVERYPELISQLLRNHDLHFFLFGGGDKEIQFFHSIQKKFPSSCTLVAGQIQIKDEIALLEKIDLMVCVDSSNMHLAALTNTPILSIWGGTHPDVGFSPYQHGDESIIQLDRTELTCRPCSVYGKKTCYRGDFACMENIGIETLATQIRKKLNL